MGDIMTIHYLDHFHQKIPDLRADGPDARYRVISAGSSRRRRRYSGGPGGGWSFVILVALVVGVVGYLSGRSPQSPTAASGTFATKPTQSPTAPGAFAINSKQLPAAAPRPPVKCATQPAAGASTNVALPDVVGQNARIASEQLQQLGLTNVELVSANQDYQMVIVPANWTVVSTSPAPCTAVNLYDHVVLNVTKPSGGFADFVEDRLSRFG
jgi:PASTA domain